MARPVSVIIAALNEEILIADAIRSAREGGAGEVIVVDGGSTDRTVRVASGEGARVITSERMRSRQFNTGARVASGHTLIFLHADTMLPMGGAVAASQALESGAIFGAFRIRFAEQTRGLRWTAWAINTRTALTRCPWGDQAQFIARETFESCGGFREIPLMEDYELAVRMKRLGRTAILPMPVITSGRRFLQRGLVRTTALNWWIVAMYRMGVSPEKLAKLYR